MEGMDFSIYEPQPAAMARPTVDGWQQLYGANGLAMPVDGRTQGNSGDYEANLGGFGFGGDPGNYNGSNGLNDDFLKNLGWTGGNPYNYGPDATFNGGVDRSQIPAQGYSPEWTNFLRDNDITLMTRPEGTDAGITQGFHSDGSQVGTSFRNKNDPDNAFGVAMLAAASLFAAPMAAAAGGATAGTAGAGMVDGAFLGEGVASGIPAWDAAYTGAGGILSGGAEAGSSLADWGSDAHFYNNPTAAEGGLGNMAGGSAVLPSMNLSGGSSWLKDIYDTAKQGKGIYDTLAGAGGAGGTGGSSGAMGPFTGGMSAGDRYRQQLAAQAIRDQGQKEPGFQSVWSGPPT